MAVAKRVGGVWAFVPHNTSLAYKQAVQIQSERLLSGQPIGHPFFVGAARASVPPAAALVVGQILKGLPVTMAAVAFRFHNYSLQIRLSGSHVHFKVALFPLMNRVRSCSQDRIFALCLHKCLCSWGFRLTLLGHRLTVLFSHETKLPLAAAGIPAPTMRPGFYSLFRRGRYRRPASMTQAERKEAERFAVAALAFTLQNNTDQSFCQHFLETICGLPKRVALECPNIFVEKHQWADLLLKVKNYVVVIECKLSAPLADAQNPQEEESFYDSEGYGGAFVEEYKGDERKRHYVVLGHRKTLRPISKREVICLQRQWHAVNDNYSS